MKNNKAFYEKYWYIPRIVSYIALIIAIVK